MTFVRRRRRRRTPSSAEMGLAGPVRKHSCGVRRHGLAGEALPSGYGRWSATSGRQGADGRGPASRLHRTLGRTGRQCHRYSAHAVPPSTAVSSRGAGFGVSPGSPASFSTSSAPEESWTGARATRTCSGLPQRPCHDQRIQRIRPARPWHMTRADVFGVTEAAAPLSHLDFVGPHGTAGGPRRRSLGVRQPRPQDRPTMPSAHRERESAHGHVTCEPRRDRHGHHRHKHHRAQHTQSPER